eukprot:GHVN01032606.1.p1 GENE.GHVN01032606.1~~GHVN01032606.1.p1  ORF type:complete len:641 (-),score=53.18 GHVN01032606.1:430-2184(-)
MFANDESFFWMNKPKAHVRGSYKKPLLATTIGDYIDNLVEVSPDQEIVSVPHQHVEWRWSTLLDRVNALAIGLLLCGFTKGQRLAVWMPNNSEWLLLQLATAKIGVILVNLNTSYVAAELVHSLNQVQCSGIVLLGRSVNHNNPERPTHMKILHDALPELSTAMKKDVRFKAAPSLCKIIVVSDVPEKGRSNTTGVLDGVTVNFEDLVAPRLVEGPLLAACQAEVSPNDDVNIQFTSGTTGRAKGATLSHINILNNAYFVGDRMRLTSDDVLCIPVPLFHCFGMVMGNLAALSHGTRIVYPCENFDAEKVMQSVQRYKCTALHGVPTMFGRILESKNIGRYQLKTLRTGIIAGSVCPVELLKRIRYELGMKELTVCYGMTETSPVSFQTPVGASTERQVATVGTILPWTEAKVVRENGDVCSVDEPGELLIRGYLVMNGYWNEKAKTNSSICPDGWMRTGDMALIDSHGYASIVGRIKDMIIRGGENISPREIEEVIHQHKSVIDVAVVGVPSHDLGEEVCAWVKLRAGETVSEFEIQEHCSALLSKQKVPRYVLFREDFPITANGKHQKNAMRTMSVHAIGLD